VKNRKLVNCSRDFSMDSSLENAAEVYNSFVSLLKENDIKLEDVIVVAVKNRYNLKKIENSRTLDSDYVTKDRFVDALMEASKVEN